LPARAASTKLTQALCHAEQVQPLSAMNHGHDQALVAESRAHADVHVPVQFERIGMKGGVDFPLGAQSLYAGTDEISGQRQARAARFEFRGVARPVRQHPVRSASNNVVTCGASRRLRAMCSATRRRIAVCSTRMLPAADIGARGACVLPDGDIGCAGRARRRAIGRRIRRMASHILRRDASIATRALDVAGGNRKFL